VFNQIVADPEEMWLVNLTKNLDFTKGHTVRVYDWEPRDPDNHPDDVWVLYVANPNYLTAASQGATLRLARSSSTPTIHGAFGSRATRSGRAIQRSGAGFTRSGSRTSVTNRAA